MFKRCLDFKTLLLCSFTVHYLLILLYYKEQQQNIDKPGQLQLKWASKPVENRKVKSLAEIQAEEEQERLAKVRVFRDSICFFIFTHAHHCSIWLKRV